ncbi:MAG TPA: hypothetical protein VD996_01955 [Chitinophagaceae bacterium]|nr:hypothetical protein [Chitinophagaceae bacterium]
MQWTILFITSLIAALIFLQDVKDRAVTWFYFPVLAIMGIAAGLADSTPAPALLTNTLVNMGFLMLQFALLTAYYSIRTGSWQLIIGKKLGWGDVLFLAAASCYFSPMNFLLFYCFSLFFTLTIHLTLRLTVWKNTPATVPLAGLQSLFLVIFLVACKVLDHHTGNDAWIFHYLTT